MAVTEGRGRTREAMKLLDESRADALVLGPGANQHYLSGFRADQSKRHLFLLVVPDAEPVFFAPEAYVEELHRESWVDELVVWTDEDDPLERLGDAFRAVGIADGDRILLNDRLWTTFSQDVRAVVDAEFGLASELLRPLRTVKDDTELGRIERASTIADEVSAAVRAMDPVGRTETELAGEIEYRMRKRGSHGVAFPTVVASGPNSAEPPYQAGDREIRADEPVVLDFGAQRAGYLSDQTRTVVFGDPPAGFREAHRVVREAQDAAVAAIEPGVVASAVDRVAREVIEAAGYGKYVRHLTGHGIGLDIHEPPFFVSGSYLGGGNELELEPGMVATVEPAVYTDDWGIRIEDSVVVTEAGCERLNGSPRGWEPL